MEPTSLPWVPVDGRDAAPNYPSYLNPGLIVSASFWTDQAQQRTVTLELVGGRKVELREPEALDAVGRLTKGIEALTAAVERHPAVSCGRSAA